MQVPFCHRILFQLDFRSRAQDNVPGPWNMFRIVFRPPSMERSFMPQEKRKQLEGEDAKLGYVHQRRDSV